MGYVPPVRDEQQIQYGNRYVHKREGIRPASPVEEARFQKVLAEKQRENNPEKKRKNQMGKKIKSEREIKPSIFGKGKYFDEIV